MKKHFIIVALFAVTMLLCSCKADVSSSITSELPIIVADTNVEVHYIDVQQGSSALIKIDQFTLVIDAGPDEAEQHIVEYLTRQGVQKIDLLVVTHPHDENLGAVDGVLEKFDTDMIIDSGMAHPGRHYQDYLGAVKQAQNSGSSYLADEDMVIFINNESYIEIIENGDDWEAVNDNSVIIRIVYGDTAFLFSGDLSSAAEQALIATGKNLQANVLLANHHGAATSNSSTFLDFVKPEFVVVSAAPHNNYPHRDTLRRLSESNIKLLETALLGEVVFSSDSSRVTHIGEIDTIAVEILSVNCRDEIVTIINNGCADVDMSGWYLISYFGDQRFDFPEGYVLKKGAEVKVSSGKLARCDGEDILEWTTSEIWSNSGPDPAYLYNESGMMISMKY